MNYKLDFILFNFFKIQIRLCSTNTLNGEVEKITSYVGSLIEFFKTYTRRTFDLDKLGNFEIINFNVKSYFLLLFHQDIVLISNNELNELIDFDNPYDHNGIIYLPADLFIRMNDPDQLTRAQIKSRIIFTLAKQLSRYWFNHYHFIDCSCSIWSQRSNSNENSSPFLIIERIFNDQFENFTTIFGCTDAECLNNKIKNNLNEDSILDYNIECFMRTGIIGWLSYMSFEFIQSDLYDLVKFRFLIFYILFVIFL